jgi:5-methyltetrahydropteroyltriglutamate--homocysteine methyltransferase
MRLVLRESVVKRSRDRILTTHVGSLPRPDDLVEVMASLEPGQQVPGLDKRVHEVVTDLVRRQVAVGIDVISDGEASKSDFVGYVQDRLTGFGGTRHPMLPPVAPSQFEQFPKWAARHAQGRHRQMLKAACNGPIAVDDPAAVHRDIANLRAALVGCEPEEIFVTAAPPGLIAARLRNEYYPTQEAYIYAIAEAMKYEYGAIVAAGFLLQIDCPDLSGRLVPPDQAKAHRADLEVRLEALNYALAGLPPERMRLHLCWGNFNGPHLEDGPLRDALDTAFRARPSAISFEGANPRHEHEWAIFKDVKLPDDKVIIPGVIDSCTNYVEHPELVAQRIVRYAELVGRENVIAGVDCGFGTFVVQQEVDPGIAWLKLQSLVEGARIASEALW